MIGQARLPSVARFMVAASLFLGWAGGWAAPPDASATPPPAWTGGIDLYRTGVFTTQKTWLWCTAADVQITRNIVDGAADHSKSGQQRYFDYMRAHNRYDIPVKDGVDPAGWAAGLRNFVDGRYRLTTSTSFDAALRAAVTNLRETNLPVAITVSHGNHAWVLTGFTATADPAVTTRFTVTSVRVVGPLWGLQSRKYGYDMRPDTKLTPAQLKTFFTPWHYAGVKMAWEGRWVSVQPVAVASPTPKPAASPPPTVRPTATAAPSTVPASSLSSAPTATTTAAATADVRPSPISTGTLPTGSSTLAAPSPVPSPATSAARDTLGGDISGGAAVLLAVAVAFAGLAVLALRRRSSA